MQVFDVDTNIDVIKHHGSTDPLILVSVLAHHGIPHDEVRIGTTRRPAHATHFAAASAHQLRCCRCHNNNKNHERGTATAPQLPSAVKQGDSFTANGSRVRLQAMAKLKEMEAAMNEYFEARSEAAGSGLVVLSGVVELLRALQVV